VFGHTAALILAKSLNLAGDNFVYLAEGRRVDSCRAYPSNLRMRPSQPLHQWYRGAV